MISINYDKCTFCERCYEVCPNYVFSTCEEEGVGKVELKYPSHCCECAHCILICPEGAITDKNIFPEKLRQIEKIEIEPDKFMNIIFSRRSIRSFKTQSVPTESIKYLLKAAGNAGTASNSQSEKFIVVQNRETLQKLEKAVIEVLWAGKSLIIRRLKEKISAPIKLMLGKKNKKSSTDYGKIFIAREKMGELYGNEKIGGMIFRNAPAVIIVTGSKKNPLAATNSALAIRTMELLAVTMGLGTCWVGFLVVAAKYSRRIDKFFNLSSDRSIYGALMIGYPKHEYIKMIDRKERVISWI
ncbi:nitroreductase family protein [Bacteroidota bacterium]